MTAIKDKLVTVEGLKYVIDNYSKDNDQLCRIVRLKTSEVSSWGDVYNQLYSMAIEDAAVIVIESGVASSLFSSLLDAHSYAGTIIRANDTSTLTGNYKLNVSSFNSNETVDFMLNGLSSASATPTLSVNGYFYGGTSKSDIRQKIAAPTFIQLTTATTSGLWDQLSQIPVGEAALFSTSSSTVTSSIFGQRVSRALAYGMVTRYVELKYDFAIFYPSVSAGHIDITRLTFSSDHSSYWSETDFYSATLTSVVSGGSN